MKKWFWSVWTIALAISTAHGQVYIHQKLGNGFSRLSKGILTELGYPAWSAERSADAGNVDVFLISGSSNVSASILGSGRDASPADYHPVYGILWDGSGSATGNRLDAFLNSTNLSASVLGGDRFALAFRLATDGRAIWYGSGPNNGNNIDIFVGSTNLTASILGNGRDAVPVDISPNNVLVWDGAGGNLGGVNRDVFTTNLTSMTSTNISQSVLGRSRFALAVAVNDLGTPLWNGAGTNNNDYNDVFLSTTNVSASALGGLTAVRDATPYGVSWNGSNNTLIWVGRASSTGWFYDTFASSVPGSSMNMSSSVLGTGRESLPVAIRVNALIWEGVGSNTSGNNDVFVSVGATTRNVSTNRFGTGGPNTRASIGYAVDSSGNALWAGKHTTTGGNNNLFYYNWSNNSSTNLTQEATSSTRETQVLATNRAMQVLWGVRDSTGNEWEVYLSTPNVATTLQGTLNIPGYLGNLGQVQVKARLVDPFTGNVASTHTGNGSNGGTYSVGVTPGLWGVRLTATGCLTRAFPIQRLLGATTINLNMILGDVNQDNIIDDADLLQILFNFGQSGSSPADLNGDGVVDDADLLIVLFNFGQAGES